MSSIPLIFWSSC